MGLLRHLVQQCDNCKIIPRDFYMDNLLTRADTEDGALQIQKDVTLILEEAGFQLRKWLSKFKVIKKLEVSDLIIGQNEKKT